ncbi:MAG: Type I Iterative PKS [Bogoriella megaspora]|nr:MAG: Type I Iterative PKS [Bogoriella megaspora]
MAATVRVYVFGDQTFDASTLLSNLLHTYDDPILSDFLDKSCLALKREIAKLGPDQQAECPRFSKFTTLLPLWRAGTLNPALSQALSCVCQIGIFIQQHGIAGTRFPTPQNACLTGRCTGLLAAAAVSCASSPADLLWLGVYTVALAFRVGACAWDIGSRICFGQDDSGRYQFWTAAISGASGEEVEGAINVLAAKKNADSREQALAKTSRPYVSARIAPLQHSVSAPPHVLDSLLSDTPLASRTSARLTITAPYHAGHLYNDEDVDALLEGLGAVPEQFQSSTSAIPIISSTTASTIPPLPFAEALRTVVKNCLQHAIRWDLTAGAVADHIQSLEADGTFSIHPIAATSDGLGSSIQKVLGRQISLDTPGPTELKLRPLQPRGVPLAKSKIAIIGASGRFPHAPSMDAFWDVLRRGVDTHEVVIPSRWNAHSHVGVSSTSMAKNVSGTGFGCWLHDAAKFDARFFNMSPREAPQVDPAQRIALLTAAEALEQAGIVPGRTQSTQKDRVGVYFGSTSNDWMETNSAQDIDTYFIPGGNRAFIPGRINYHFKFSGPSYTIDTACSSSLAAIHLACNALWRGEVDTAIVGGTNVLTNPDMTAGLDRGHFLSRTGNCKTFDDEADGYCRGEAVGTVILKRLDDAIVDKDPVRACILSIATNHSAEAESITRPHVGAQQALFESVLAEAGVDANSISYCEMHGTGTQAGDAGETASVLATLAPDKPPVAVRKSHEPLYIGAAKANIGHGEAAAGVTSLAKVLMMLKHSTIPPHCGIKNKINHKLPDLDSRNTFIAKAPLPWPRPEQGARQVLLNNFSAAGGNTALVLEDAPELPSSNTPDTRDHHLVVVSGKVPASLENNLKNLVAWIDEQQDSSNLTLSQLSYTTTARRMHHPHRVVAHGSDLQAIRKMLQNSLEQKEGSSRPKGTPGFILAFSGQGAHFVGMGADLYSRLSDFRNDIRRYDQICLQLNLPSIRHLFEDPSASYDEATPTMLQLALVCLQMALFRMWISLGVVPRAVVGHSLGEYSALYAAGVLSQVDVIHLVGKRAQMLEQNCEEGSHAMLAIRSNASGLESLLGPPGESYEVSCFNGRESTVLGGTSAQMNTVRPKLTKRGLSHTFLQVPYAYHTSQVDPVLTPLGSLAQNVRFAKPKIPVISPTYGKVLRQSEDFSSDFVVRHCRGTVNMLGALDAAKSDGILDEKMLGIEIGPAPVVIKMVKDVAGPNFQHFASIRKDEDTWKLLVQALSKSYSAGADINWTAYHKDFESAQRCLDLPAYSWDLKEYWIQYVHDWSLRKGDPPLRIGPISLESSTIHKVVSDTLNSNGGELVVEADLSRPDLHPMVQGHKVYGVPLCTPSVYADIALTIGQHVKEILEPGNDSIAAEVGKMTIQSALVANSDNSLQMLRTVATLDPTTKTVLCKFSSANGKGEITEQHANCVIRLFDAAAARKNLELSADQIRSRISSLKNQVGSSGNTFRFSKAMIYKMVGQLADFDPNYRGLAEIILDNSTLEATGNVSFLNVLNEGKFHTNPAYIDALSQLGGFVMNGNEGVDLDKELFVNHGWESLQLFESVDPAKQYTTHVRMFEGEDKLWNGDITIFDGDRVVGTIGGVALQGVPKRLMQFIVNSANKRSSAQASGTKASSAAPSSAPKSNLAVNAVVTKKTTTQSKVAQQPLETSAVTTAMEMISQESGIEMGELTDDSRFDDIGIDSLLSLVVSSRIRDELGIELESSVFFEVSTIGSFKTYLRGLSGQTQEITTVNEVVEEEIVPISNAPLSIDTQGMEGVWKSVLDIIAEESGIVVSELTGDTSFADVGVDSLLSLVICSRIRDELELDIADRSLFLDFPTIETLRNHLIGDRHVSPEAGEDHSSSESTTTTHSRTSPSSSEKDFVGTPDTEVLDLLPADAITIPTQPYLPIKPAWSITLQGSSKRADKRLFLFPDGCGAATSYVKLPRLSPSTAVIGFNSPFMRTPSEMSQYGLSHVLSSYLETLRKQQPTGPYHLGGWSAGGILAYATAQELMAAGETVASLTLIDSPAPTRGLDRLPKRFFDHCTSVGIFGSEMGATTTAHDAAAKASTGIGAETTASGEGPGAKVPEWLMPHFEATIDLLHDYRAPRMPPPAEAKSPEKVTIIWAGSCAFDGERYAKLPAAAREGEDTEGMKFLTEQRTDFGPGDWADLFPGRRISMHVVEGEHHFSMMRDQGADQLGRFIRDSLGLKD